MTGWRTGGGESHGTSSVDYHDYHSREYLKQADVVANDSFDYTGDTWWISFDATGMPQIQYSGTVKTNEHYSASSTGVMAGPNREIDLQQSRPRSAVSDPV